MTWSISDDPYADFDKWDAEQWEELQRLPICARCKERIQDEYLYDVEGRILCQTCMEKEYEKSVEDYME